MDIEEEAKRIEASINARAAALMAGPASERAAMLARFPPIDRFQHSLTSDPIPLPRSEDRAEIIRALAADLPAEWEWSVVEGMLGDAELVITGHRPADGR